MSDDSRWLLPSSWTWTKLGTLSKIVGGGTPRKAKLEHNYDEDGTAWITPADLSGYTRTYIKGGRRSLSEIGFKNSSAKIMPKGTVLLSSRAPVGYCAIAANDISTNQGFKSILPSVAHDPRYMRYYLLASKGYLEQNASGTTFSELSGASVKALLFPVAPIAEQERIVDKIDELFSSIEAGERAIEQARAGVARYRKAILKAAVTGELTADWRIENPPKESAKDLLARILTVRYEAWEKSELAKLEAKGKEPPQTEKQWEKFRARYKAPVEPHSEGLSELPESWINTTVDQLSEFITSGSRGWAKYYSDTGAVFVRVGNLNRSSVEIDFEKLQFVSPPEGAEGARTRLVLNDILVSITADVGMVGVFRDQYSEAYINQHVALVRVPDEVNQDWVSWAIVSPTKQQEILGTGRGATKDGLTLSDLRELVVPFPPKSEQIEIVNRVELALSKADAVKATLDAQSRAAKALKQAVLKTAFEGKLVPQNPKDEPASELLKRIKAAS